MTIPTQLNDYEAQTLQLLAEQKLSIEEMQGAGRRGALRKLEKLGYVAEEEMISYFVLGDGYEEVKKIEEKGDMF